MNLYVVRKKTVTIVQTKRHRDKTEKETELWRKDHPLKKGETCQDLPADGLCPIETATRKNMRKTETLARHEDTAQTLTAMN